MMALVNKPSQLLSDEINNTVFTQMLKPNCISLVTTLTTFAYNFNGKFGPKTAGILCFEKDSSSGLHYIRLYNMDTNQMFFDELVGPSGIEFTSDEPPSLFEIQFASGISVGLWFLPEPEAEAEARDLEKAFLSVCKVAKSPAGNPGQNDDSKVKKKNRMGARARRRKMQRAAKAESPSKTEEKQTPSESSEDHSDEKAMNLMDTLKKQLLARQLADLKEIRAKKEAKQVAAAKTALQTKNASLPSSSKKPLPQTTIVVQPPSPQKPLPRPTIVVEPPSPQKPLPPPTIVVQPPSPQKPLPRPTIVVQPPSPQKPLPRPTIVVEPPSPQKPLPRPTIVVEPPSPQKPLPPTAATQQLQSLEKSTPPPPAIVVQPPSPQKPKSPQKATPTQAANQPQSPQKVTPTQAVKGQQPAEPNTTATPSSEAPIKSPGRQVKDDDEDFQATQDMAAKWQQRRAKNQKNAGQGG